MGPAGILDYPDAPTTLLPKVQQKNANEFGDCLVFLRHLYGKMMEKICLKTL